MYVIAGATGNVGSVAAAELLANGQPVRVIVRSEAKAKPFAEKGAQVAVGTLEDQEFLTQTFKGATGVFVLLPPNFAAEDFLAYQRRTADVIVAAVKAAAVPHVVLLSSIGADQESGLGPIVGLNYFERRLQESATQLTTLRPGYFAENVAMGLEPAKSQGIYPSFMPESVAMPMIATRDIGAVVARTLLEPPEGNQVIDIVGPSYTAVDVANKLSEKLGKRVNVVVIPPEGWVGAMTQSGVPPQFAELYAEMYDGFSKGLARPVGNQLVEGKTPLEAVVAKLV